MSIISDTISPFYEKKTNLKKKHLEVVDLYMRNFPVKKIQEKLNYNSRQSIYNALDRYEKTNKISIRRERRNDPRVNYYKRGEDIPIRENISVKKAYPKIEAR